MLDDKPDISECTDKEGQKRTTFRFLADPYRLLQAEDRGPQASPQLLLGK